MLNRKDRETLLIKKIASYFNWSAADKIRVEWLADLPFDHLAYANEADPIWPDKQLTTYKQALWDADRVAEAQRLPGAVPIINQREKWAEVHHNNLMLTTRVTQLSLTNSELTDKLATATETVKQITAYRDYDGKKLASAEALNHELTYKLAAALGREVKLKDDLGIAHARDAESKREITKLRERAQMAESVAAASMKPAINYYPRPESYFYNLTQMIKLDDRVIIGFDPGRPDGDYTCHVTYSQSEGKFRILEVKTRQESGL